MADETPMIAHVDCGLLGPDGSPATILRAADDSELAQLAKDEQERAASPPPPATLEERAAVLEKLPPDRVVTASDLLAILRPEETA